MEIFLQINHKPMAKTRPRFSYFKGKSRIYDTQSNIMRRIKRVFGKQMRDKDHLKIAEGPIFFKMTAHMPIPKMSAKKTIKMDGMPHVKKPDCDNMIKFYSDILNGVAYHDDSQICSMLCEKFYSSKPRVEIVIKRYN